MQRHQISQANNAWFPVKETLFRIILNLGGVAIFALFVYFFISLVQQSLPSIKLFGLQFVINTQWDPVADQFGALPFIAGTLVTSVLALLISIPFSLSISIFLGEYVSKGPLSFFLRSVIELLAGIPSVVYGFWGLMVLVPIVRNFELMIGVAPYGVGVLTASIILAIMIIPYSASLGREVIALVPDDLKEAALAMGATRFEVIKSVVIPYCRSGLFSGFLLSLGRALGETMAVTMVIGNANKLLTSIFDPSNSMASIIANEFAEATGDIYLSSLVELGLILFIITAILSFIGRVIIKKLSVQSK